jgi:hydroxyacylglutathione hydrolase
MPAAVTTIPLSGVNCYLLSAGDGFALVDTGLATKRAALETQLTAAGCTPGALRVIVLTHGDVDHAGNAAFLHQRYGAPVAMHAGDAPMVETGDMDRGRKPKPDKVTAAGRLIRVAGTLMELLRRGDTLERFTPDLFVDEDADLAACGLDARVLHLPGHSPGSIGLLTPAGDLFCGDLLYHWRTVSVPICDDATAHAASMRKLRGLDVKTVYPGHGKPFPWSEVPVGM